MAALAFGVIAVVRELYSVTNVFIRFRCDVQKSLNYIRTKNRLRLFQKYCEVIWLQYEYESLGDCNTNSNSIENSNPKSGRRDRKSKIMRRGRIVAGADIDFAAYEATSMAREAADGYLMNTVEENSNDDTIDAAAGGVGTEGDLDFEIYENPDDIEIVDGVEADVSYYDTIEIHPQAREENVGELREGVSFTIAGRILLTCERFSINFLIENPTHDVALHVNPRLPQNYIVRNTRVRNVWGREEIATQLPFNLGRGKDFEIQVLITNESFMISSQGVHVADFNHRLPYQTIKAIEVKGDVENCTIQRNIVDHYPQRQPHQIHKISEKLLGLKFREFVNGKPPEWAFYDELKTKIAVRDLRATVVTKELELIPTPYVGVLEAGSLSEGRVLQIQGRIKLLPHSFYINLMDGMNIWPHQNIALHFNPRFSARSGAKLGKAIVCRNAWYDGKWGKEERSELDTNLRPGKQFTMMIRCAKDSFIVYVDRKYITSFKHHVSPDIVNTVYIRGDVFLIDVALMVSQLKRAPETNISVNPSFENLENEIEYSNMETAQSDLDTEKDVNRSA